MTAPTTPTTPTTPDVERELAFDMLRRGLPAAPAIIIACGLIWGTKGAWTALLAVAIVAVNLIASALSLGWAAKVSPAVLMGTAMGGFLVRMGVLTAVIFAVRDQPWVSLPALAASILTTHLGLLFWETRYVGATLAFPGIKPRQSGA